MGEGLAEASALEDDAATHTDPVFESEVQSQNVARFAPPPIAAGDRARIGSRAADDATAASTAASSSVACQKSGSFRCSSRPRKRSNSSMSIELSLPAMVWKASRTTGLILLYQTAASSSSNVSRFIICQREGEQSRYTM